MPLQGPFDISLTKSGNDLMPGKTEIYVYYAFGEIKPFLSVLPKRGSKKPA